jgi:hypothetical protein
VTHKLANCRKPGLLVLTLLATIFQPHAVSAQSQSPSVQELQQQISKRDALISDLMRRVEALEQKLGKTAAPDQPSSGAPEVTKPAGPETAKPSGRETVMDIGEEESVRALERTLVRERAIILPPWSVEVEPRYVHVSTHARRQAIAYRRPADYCSAKLKTRHLGGHARLSSGSAMEVSARRGCAV